MPRELLFSFMDTDSTSPTSAKQPEIISYSTSIVMSEKPASVNAVDSSS